MNRNLKMAAVLATAALAMTACGVDPSDDCGTTSVMFFNATDHHYHYGSPTGRTVPADKVPRSARKAPGYKAPAPAPQKPGVNKSGGSAPKPAPAPKAPAPKAGGRR